ncbi:hypothetical protein [Streptomyces sp. NPDC054887]
MKLLHKAVLLGWALAVAAGAVIGAGEVTPAGTGTSGASRHDTGWG